MTAKLFSQIARRVTSVSHRRGGNAISYSGFRCISSSPPLFDVTGDRTNILQSPSDLVQTLRLSHSVEPTPYTDTFELTPNNIPMDKLGHKKVTVVGCGQVGMAIAYSMLNQVTAGTIALVDMNKDKLEGEAKDLEQGSAFHQHVRILASDEYVSILFRNISLGFAKNVAY